MKRISRFEKIFVLGLVLSLFTLHNSQADTSLFLEKTSGKGHLRIQNGIPVLYLYGTPEEIGTQYGDILKSHVRVLMNEWLRPMYPEEENWDKAIADAKALEPGKQTIHVAITDVNPAADGPYRKLTARDMFDVPPAVPSEAPGSSQPGLLPEPN